MEAYTVVFGVSRGGFESLFRLVASRLVADFRVYFPSRSDGLRFSTRLGSSSWPSHRATQVDQHRRNGGFGWEGRGEVVEGDDCLKARDDGTTREVLLLSGFFL